MYKEKLAQQAVEDYLKTIYLLAEKESPVGTSRIAEARQVSPASATTMVQRLAKLGLVNYQKNRGVTLTTKGQKTALVVLRHHRLIELYLTQALGFTWDEVHEQAEVLEHVISGKLEERITAVLHNPTINPHGEPIPNKEGNIACKTDRPLTTLNKGSRAIITRIADDTNSEFLRYLSGLGITLQKEVTLLDVSSFDGLFTLQIEDKQQIVGHKVASTLYVR